MLLEDAVGLRIEQLCIERRIIDESGEDYLYPPMLFEIVEK